MPHSRRDVQKSTFARFLGLIDFRLLQQYRPTAAIHTRDKAMASVSDFNAKRGLMVRSEGGEDASNFNNLPR
jgi:hypothetical protein